MWLIFMKIDLIRLFDIFLMECGLFDLKKIQLNLM